MFWKRFYDEPQAFAITETVAKEQLSKIYYHVQPILDDLDSGIVVLTPCSAYGKNHLAVDNAIDGTD